MIKLKYFYDFITKSRLSKELNAKKCFYVILFRWLKLLLHTLDNKNMTSDETCFCLRKISLLFRNESKKKFFPMFWNSFDFLVGRNFLLCFMIEIIINAAKCCIELLYNVLWKNPEWNLNLKKNNLFWTSNSYMIKKTAILCKQFNFIFAFNIHEKYKGSRK